MKDHQGVEPLNGYDERSRPRADGRLYKGHGLGNDYLVVEAGDAWTMDPEAVRDVCHRLEGPGGDGIVALLASEPPFPLRMFNPDGSEFERSGNGLRVLASYLHRTGRVGEEPFRITVGGDEIEMRVHGVDRGEYDVSVEMGIARLGASAVELDSGAVDDEGMLRLEGLEPLTAIHVSVGNPHCVVWGEPDPFPTLERATLDRIGPRVATHDAYARGINVQLARRIDDDTLEALVWERGVGHTTASGTSACAVAVSAVASGRVPAGEKVVVMEGGELRVSVDEARGVVLRGPVRSVFDGELDGGFLERLAGGS